MRRKPNIPAMFLTALALGMWVGASWHSAAQPLSFAQSNAACKSCCRFTNTISKPFKTAQVAASDAVDPTECAACIAGALVHDAPPVFSSASLQINAPSDIASVLESVCFSAPVYTHPPERGPPA